MHHNNYHSINKSGFALLITLIVVSVVVSVGLTLLDLTIKQLKLAGGSKDSEIAFHAANAGVECARYWRGLSTERDKFEDGRSVTMSCFGQPTESIASVQHGSSAIYEYNFRFTGGTDRCSVVKMVTLSSNPDAPPNGQGYAVVLNNANTIIPGYTETSKGCQPGGRCTIISAQGYNKACVTAGNNFSIGTVQREVLLEL